MDSSVIYPRPYKFGLVSRFVRLFVFMSLVVENLLTEVVVNRQEILKSVLILNFRV